MVKLFFFIPAETALGTFEQNSITFCILREAASDILSAALWRQVVVDDVVKFDFIGYTVAEVLHTKLMKVAFLPLDKAKHCRF